MMRKIRDYRIGELAALAGVTVRTLRHYDAKGLLKPSHVAEGSGYRLYGPEDLRRLQEILLLRAMGMSLTEIAVALAGGEARLDRLRRQREVLRGRARGLAGMLATVEAAIAELEGGPEMADEALYRGITPAKQKEYEDWLTARGLGEAVAHAKAGPVDARPGDWAAVEAPLVALFKAGVAPDAAASHAPLEAHRALVARFWRRDCAPEAYAGLADTYGHPDFVARYEALAAGFSAWLPAAMRAHAGRLERG